MIKKKWPLNLLLLLGVVACHSAPPREETGRSVSESSPDSLKSKEVDSVQIIAPKGTQLLPYSKKTLYVNELSAYFFKGVDMFACESSGPGPDPEAHHRLEEITETDSTMSIRFSLISTCGSEFLTEVALVDKNCLNLIYHAYDSWADCHCAFSLTFHFRKHGTDELESDVTIKYLSFNGEDKVRFK